MPKVNYTAAKGLIQNTGEGIELDNREVINDQKNATLSATKIVSVLSASSGQVGVTLPSNASAGQVKFIFVDNVANTVVLSGSNTHNAVNTTFNAKGDGAICIFDGSLWSVLINNS